MAGRSDGQVAIISGAGTGIGAASARLFAAEGSRVVLLGRRREPLEQLAEELGAVALAVPTDVTDPDAVAEATKRTIETFGAIDVVVNSAGVADPTPLSDMTPEVWRKTIDIDLSGTFYLSREAGLWMRDNGGGSIVNVSSGMAELGSPTLVAYCAAKAGVGGLTRAMAIELAPSVRVNAVLPGPVASPMLDYELDIAGANEDMVAGMLPIKRVGTSEEIAATILHVAVEATFMTGSSVVIDGGVTVSE